MINLYYIKYQFSIDKSGFNTMAKKEVYSLFVELETPPLDDYQDVDAAFQKHLKDEFDRYFLSEGFKHTGGRRRYNIGRPICNSQFVILQWQDLNDDKFKARAGSFFKDFPAAFDKVQSIIIEAKDVYKAITQLDRGEPVPPLTVQTPALDTAPKDAAQPPAVDAAAEQAESNQTKKTYKQRTPIDIKLALEVYHALRDGETQGAIAKKYKFDESQFRKNPLLIEVKKQSEIEFDENKVARRLTSVSLAQREGKLEDGGTYIDFDNDNDFD